MILMIAIMISGKVSERGFFQGGAHSMGSGVKGCFFKMAFVPKSTLSKEHCSKDTSLRKHLIQETLSLETLIPNGICSM